jgi:hypothetical protein
MFMHTLEDAKQPELVLNVGFFYFCVDGSIYGFALHGGLCVGVWQISGSGVVIGF